MVNISDLLSWSYWRERRYQLIIGASLVLASNELVVSHTSILSGSNPSGAVWGALLLVALLVPIGVFSMISMDELKAVVANSVTAFFLLITGVIVGHALFANSMTVEQFTNQNSVATILIGFATVAVLLSAGGTVVFLVRYLYQSKMGGSGGSSTTPEEAVLSEEEYANFDPIGEKDTKALGKAIGLIKRRDSGE